MWSRYADGVTIIVYEWQAMEGTCSDRNIGCSSYV